MHSHSKKVIIALGSNIGNRSENLLHAIQHLQKNNFTITRKSSVWETEPWGDQNQGLFFNMCIEAETDLTETEMLVILKQIEKKMLRVKTRHWGPRIIDLDIIFSGNTILESKDLTIPHKMMHLRGFVLKPLSEIAPTWQHPVLKKNVQELLDDLLHKEELNMKKVEIYAE